MRTRRALGVAVLFAVTVVSIPVQMGIAYFAEEPYPALFLPAFGIVPEEPGVREVGVRRVVVDYADGTQVEYRPQALWPEATLPARMQDFTFGGERADDPAAQEWLQRRVTELGGRGPAERVQLVWTRVRYPTTGEGEPSSRPEKTIVVDYAEGA